MKQITYWVHNLSPLNFAEKNNDATLYTTRDYITGSAVRGMMAEAFIRQYQLGKEAHKIQLFMICSCPVKCGFCRPIR